MKTYWIRLSSGYVLQAMMCDGRWKLTGVKQTPTCWNWQRGKGRALITYDKDFGDLVHRDGMSAPHGVILFRIHSDVPDTVEAEFVASSVMAWDSLPPGIWTIQIRHQ